MTDQGRRPAQTTFSERVASFCMLMLFGLLCGAGSVALWVDATDTQPQFVLDNPKPAKHPCTVRHGR